MSLRSQAQCLDTEKQLLGCKGVQGCAEVSLNLDAGSDDESNGAEGVVELEAVVALCWIVELGEPLCVLAPVKLSTVDDYTTNCCSVAYKS